MRKGVNLSLTKSLFEIDKMLDQAVKAVQKILSAENSIHGIKKLSAAKYIYNENELKFRAGKSIQINYDKEDEYKHEYFWIGFAWKEETKHKFCIVLEFNKSLMFWDRYYTGAKELTGTSGEYYSKVEDEYSLVHDNSWIRFYLKNNYLKQFYDEKIDKNSQLEILTGFINEVLEKCRKKYEQKKNCPESDINVDIDNFFKKLHENLKKTEWKESFPGFANFSDIFNHEFFRNHDKDK